MNVSNVLKSTKVVRVEQVEGVVDADDAVTVVEGELTTQKAFRTLRSKSEAIEGVFHDAVHEAQRNAVEACAIYFLESFVADIGNHVMLTVEEGEERKGKERKVTGNNDTKE